VITSDPRILIVRLGSLGDVVHAIPVAAALRDRFPGARIDWMVDPRYVELLRLVPVLDACVPVEPRGAWPRLLRTIRQCRDVRYAAAVDLQGLLKSAVLARAAGAARTVGFSRGHLREPVARLFYTETVAPDGVAHVVHKNLALLHAIGVRATTPAFPLTIPQTPVAAAVAAGSGSHGYVLLNPGAGWPNKQWPAERFGTAAREIRTRLGMRSVVLWGPGEHALASAVAAASEGAADVSPPTTVTDLVALARGARIMVAGDTGPLHLAAAAGTPVVALFGPSRPERNGPWAPSDITLSRADGCICLYRRRCRRGTPCIDDIAPEEVVSAVERRLTRA
jgi:heptosyltransferase I